MLKHFRECPLKIIKKSFPPLKSLLPCFSLFTVLLFYLRLSTLRAVSQDQCVGSFCSASLHLDAVSLLTCLELKRGHEYGGNEEGWVCR